MKVEYLVQPLLEGKPVEIRVSPMLQGPQLLHPSFLCFFPWFLFRFTVKTSWNSVGNNFSKLYFDF